MKLLLLSLLLELVLSQSLINRLKIVGDESAAGCWLKLRNTEEIIDLRTNCRLPNGTDSPKYQTLLNFIKPKASYLIKNGEEVRGYRYFKDPLNYKFKQYDFELYHSAINTTLEQLTITQVPLHFEDRYSFDLSWNPERESWVLVLFSVQYRNPVGEIVSPSGYKVQRWLQKKQGGDKSIAIRKLAGSGANQAVNFTLELALEDQSNINPQLCKVVIEQIVPEWFFVDYDELRTLVKYEVFDIELPEHFSKQYFFKYTVPFTKFVKLGHQRYSYQYKLRVRYPRPTSDDSYTVPIGLHPNDKVTIECEGKEKINVEQDLLNDRGHGKMFAGRAKDTKSVTMWTYLLTTVICIMALKMVKIPKAPTTE